MLFQTSFLHSLLKNDNHTEEGGRVLSISEFQPTTEKTDFHVWLLVDIVVEIGCVRAGRDK